MKRLLGLVCLLAAILIAANAAFRVNAAATDFLIKTLDCSTTPGTITIANTSTATTNLDGLAVQITQAGSTTPTILNINAAINPPSPPAPDYTVGAGNSVVLQVGPGATQTPSPATNPLDPNQTVALSTQALLQPGATVQLINPFTSTTIGGPQTCGFGVGGSGSMFVSTTGHDFIAPGQPNTLCAPHTLPTGTAPTPQTPGPCLTINHAMQYEIDGGTIYVDFGYYEICQTIEVNKLVRVTTRQDALGGNTNFGAAPTGQATIALNGAVLHSFTGDTVFHVTAVGYPDATSPSNLGSTVPANLGAGGHSLNVNHAAIDGFHIGGAFKAGAAAIMLDNDAYTAVSNNWIGGDDINNPQYNGVPCEQPEPTPPAAFPSFSVKNEVMGNSAGIILSNSDHPNVFNNAVLGSSHFKYAPVLSSGAVQSGFGIVTSECL